MTIWDNQFTELLITVAQFMFFGYVLQLRVEYDEEDEDESKNLIKNENQWQKNIQNNFKKFKKQADYLSFLLEESKTATFILNSDFKELYSNQKAQSMIQDYYNDFSLLLKYITLQKIITKDKDFIESVLNKNDKNYKIKNPLNQQSTMNNNDFFTDDILSLKDIKLYEFIQLIIKNKLFQQQPTNKANKELKMNKKDISSIEEISSQQYMNASLIQQRNQNKNAINAKNKARLSTSQSQSLLSSRISIQKDTNNGKKKTFLLNINNNNDDVYQNQNQRRPSIFKKQVKNNFMKSISDSQSSFGNSNTLNIQYQQVSNENNDDLDYENSDSI
ncbi:hypothetical protein PPERSA_11161 [Pseudocohnilembus persalinus]|uniref:Uncharacterized protein n=1 Tax=Pseudocohnilembus persalinus TaxID=266149 RepID=A0A0V0QZ65_PSEPJ|nr:hypothetical protein PPERSA_11161 [Pseudocohnilembus persalinus]|eukprot:KRX07612.1 hypothetical protein PPERSA_11161 [Pseudocohnilembus persalinus]